MDVIYETPNNEYIIIKQTDVNWQTVFGKESVWYNAVKKSSKDIIYSGLSIIATLKWLRKMNIISEDEMKFQIEKIGK